MGQPLDTTDSIEIGIDKYVDCMDIGQWHSGQ